MRAGLGFFLATVMFFAPTLAHSEEKVIVVGFVGGFVRHDDPRHAEVQFANYLRQKYRQAIEVAVFGNHAQDSALRYVLETLPKHKPARIIIFGHSWGGTATVRLARALEGRHIPVLLTIEVDSIAKPGQDNRVIPANVANAVNFYQTTGLLHGRQRIQAEDPRQTRILGNFEMSYRDHSINCDEFPWYSRFFTRSHIEIENDPRVWNRAAAYIDEELTHSAGSGQAGSSGGMRE